ncbi:MAG: bifunctional pyr operon transcriptional regulator/uracil phosphoribosyltransferase PyrR [Planctomycetota bacterium]|nr:bifunctional pyr operon transcriptional regulator/uracil phosphoribosyltransferase PyrR [Planctomycetota bacterium]
MGQRRFLDKESVQAAIEHLADQVVRDGFENLALVGIKRRGVPIAERMLKAIKEKHGKDVLYGVLDITLYRDDLTQIAEKPQFKGSDFNFELSGKRVVLIDDVLYTGRTIRAAMDALIRQGRPAKIELGVLVDRGWREFPIEANYAPHRIATSANEVVKVHLQEVDGEDDVEIVYLDA